jgi:hypothetical protein
MFSEDYLGDHYRQGYASVTMGSHQGAPLLLADALHGMRVDDPSSEAYYRGRIGEEGGHAPSLRQATVH